LEPTVRRCSIASFRLVAGALVAAGALGGLGCGTSHNDGYGATPGDASTGATDTGMQTFGGPDGGSPDGPTFGNQGDAEPIGPVSTCANGGATTVSGTVYDPAGKNPLYNIAVFVPSTTPSAFTSGASCETCAQLYTGNPVASALTDATGKFTMTGVPAGASVPLVIQIGKWRKQMTIPVTACQDNPQPDKSLTLPSSHTAGDIPNIAISTGNSDTLECLLARIGVEESEYTGGATGPGRLHIYQGGSLISVIAGGAAPNTTPAGPASSASLWDTDADIMQYDLVLLSCEGIEAQSANQQVLFDYASAGGRVFASHFHYSWFNTGPFGVENLATWTTGVNGIGNVNATMVTTLPNGQPFPKGVAMQQWLGNVGALTNGELPIQDGKHNSDVSASNTASQGWLVADSSSQAPGATQYFSFNTPVNAVNACGRVVYSDMHVGGASGDMPSKGVPQECNIVDLSPQEKALEFMLFDLSSCVTPNSQPPTPPPATPQ